MKLPGGLPPLAGETRGLRLARLLRGHGLFFAIVAGWLASLFGAGRASGLLVWSAGLLYVCYDTALLSYVAWATRRLRAAPAAAATSARPSVAVIVAARNERSVLQACIGALLAQGDLPEQILVVDDGSTDDSATMLQDRFGLVPQPDGLARQGRLAVLAKAHGGKARALNEALRRLDTDIVVTIDADTMLDAGAVAALRTAFAQDPLLVTVSGVLRPRCAGGAVAAMFEWFQRYEYLRAFLSRAAWAQSNALLLVSGAFAGFRREAVLRVGGFDPHSRVEDYELIHRLHRCSAEQGLGWRVRVLGDAYAETDAPASLPAFLRQRRRWFAGFLETQYEYRDLVGNARYGAVGLRMLPVKVIDTMQPVFGVTAFLLLLWLLLSRHPALPAVLLTLLAKLVLDLGYHLWSVHVYHRWLGRPAGTRTWLLAIAAALAEPFSFQLFRHAGAVLGWLTVLHGRNDWAPRSGADIATEEPN